MIDNMHGIFKSALEAYEAGKKEGATMAFETAIRATSSVGNGFERSGDAIAFRSIEAAIVEIQKAKSQTIGDRVLQ